MCHRYVDSNRLWKDRVLKRNLIDLMYWIKEDNLIFLNIYLQNKDSQYYSILDSSKWLRHVAKCIAFADEAAAHLSENVSVVLQEGTIEL